MSRSVTLAIFALCFIQLGWRSGALILMVSAAVVWIVDCFTE